VLARVCEPRNYERADRRDDAERESHIIFNDTIGKLEMIHITYDKSHRVTG